MDTVYNKAIEWIHRNTLEDVNGKGICITDCQRKIYPEVSGYYIPSLLQAGEQELAISYAKYLCSIQGSDGAWYDADGEVRQIFDSGQILKGLLAIYPLLPEVKPHIIQGCDWILSTMDEKGKLCQPLEEEKHWNDWYCNELILIYVLSPILKAAELYDIPAYKGKVEKAIHYYLSNYHDQIVSFSLFAHFYAYVIEGLIDCGKVEIAQEAMNNLKQFQKKNGSIPGYKDVEWTCSTALFQFATIWYKLGDKTSGDKTYRYACSLQNPSGGWYGSYSSPIFAKTNKIWGKLRLTKSMYLKKEEISWAVKYYLDATQLRTSL